MVRLKEFLSLKNIEESQIYKELKCSKNEALILRELCKNYVISISSINAFTLLTGIFGSEKYSYLDTLEDLKRLIERGFINQNSGFFKNIESNKSQNLILSLLQSELSLSEYFLEFLEAKPRLNLDKKEAYGEYLEYLKDEFMRVELYERLSFIRSSTYSDELKAQIKLYEKHIKERLKKSKFYNILADIFKEYSLEYKEQIIFLALLKEEYTPMICAKLNLPFVPIRKPNKLPSNTYSCEYELEYGTDRVEIHQDAFRNIKNAKILLVDDLIATGGTALASFELIKKAGGECIEACFLMNLKNLGGEEKLQKHCSVYSVLEF